jgi:prepilin-type processing-associated H-X9-DG protein
LLGGSAAAVLASRAMEARLINILWWDGHG